MNNLKFNLYSYYKKKWLLPLIFVGILVVSIVGCIVLKFKIKCGIAYDICLSIFTGNLVFFLTQLMLFINKNPKIKMQEDCEKLFSVRYKLKNIDDRLIKIESLKEEEDFIELKNLLKEVYNLLRSNEKLLKRTSKILSKRVDYVFWAHLFLLEHEIDKIDLDKFLNDDKTLIKIGDISLKYNMVMHYFRDKLETVFKQAQELFEDFNLFYESESKKITKEIF